MLGIVCGMADEARTLGPLRSDPRIAVRIAAADPDRAEQAARTLVGLGCVRLLSWGIAGGLDPALAPGTLLTGGEVADGQGGQVHVLDPVHDAGRTVAALGVDAPLMTASDKADARDRGFAMVDMESHRIARAGAAAGVPVSVIRAVADPAGRDLPALVVAAIGADGRPRIGHVLGGLLRRPALLPALIRLGRDRAAALAALRRFAATDGLAPLLD